MTVSVDRYEEQPLVKTKIVATIGPACSSPEQLARLVRAGVDVFRLNFAHADHDASREIVTTIRRIGDELGKAVGILGDLSGPKIRLGILPEDGLQVEAGQRYEFVRDGEGDANVPNRLTASYAGLVDDLQVGERVLLADGTVSMRVVEALPDRAVCEVEQAGLLRSRQGINLPGTRIRMPSLTEKDRVDLAWALEQKLDFVSLSFVRSADDLHELRTLVDEVDGVRPLLVAKIEKPEAIEQLDGILDATDVVMVARGDLGVEVDIVRVPTLQKRIIRACNQRRVPVITATQMLDSMQENELPTRAEASDVANAVYDGTDAVMLSGETAIGEYPVHSVAMMSRIVVEAEPFVEPNRELPLGLSGRNAATELTRAVALGAIHAGERIEAKLLVVMTHSGRTAIAVSKLRSRIPIVAVTDDIAQARRMALSWGVTPLVTRTCSESTADVLDFVVNWGRREGVLEPGDRIVLVGTTNWAREGKDVMRVHTVG